jgi:hypothetical protein
MNCIIASGSPGIVELHGHADAAASVVASEHVLVWPGSTQKPLSHRMPGGQAFMHWMQVSSGML